MIDESFQIPELYDLKHRKDNLLHVHYDYETNLMNKMFPVYTLKNPTLSNYLSQFKNLMVWMLECNLFFRNFYNFSVSRFYSNHSN